MLLLCNYKENQVVKIINEGLSIARNLHNFLFIPSRDLICGNGDCIDGWVYRTCVSIINKILNAKIRAEQIVDAN